MRKMPHTTFSGKKIARNFSAKMVMVGGGFHGMMKADLKKLTYKNMSSTAVVIEKRFRLVGSFWNPAAISQVQVLWTIQP